MGRLYCGSVICSRQIAACPEFLYDLSDFLSNAPALLLPSRIEMPIKVNGMADDIWRKSMSVIAGSIGGH